MKKEKILLFVDYTDNKGEFWLDSCIKNKIFTVDKDIHETIKKAMENNDFVELLYKGKPRANVFVDNKEGEAKAVGYIYRVKSEIEGKRAYFDAWVTIKKVEDYPVKELNI